ncbi:MAG: hypothetical protein U9O87_06805 [Verrucomicrobiota bacterium]|nr:hypothetical protein [Verrucomicrobiota bacterium]
MFGEKLLLEQTWNGYFQDYHGQSFSGTDSSDPIAFATGGIFICPSAPTMSLVPFEDGALKYKSASSTDCSYNSYGGLYQHWNEGVDGEDGNIFSFKATSFSKPLQVPYQYYCTKRHYEDHSSLGYNDPYGAYSWHDRTRPTVFFR